MNKFKNKIKLLPKIIILTLLVLCNMNISALTTESDTDGTSTPTGSGPCGDGEGCGAYSNYFHIRVSMVDQNRNLVAGTKILDFGATSENSSLYTSTYDSKANIISSNSEPHYPSKSNNLFIGSSMVNDGELPNNVPTSNGNVLIYHTYLGFDTTTSVTIDQQRQQFITYASNIANKKNKVNQKTVSFLELLLNLNGFSDNSDNQYILSNEEYESISNNEYYLIIEPVYYVSAVYATNDRLTDLDWHLVQGTSKQLANYFYNNYATKIGNRSSVFLYDKLWIPYSSDIAYNHTCNFIDDSGYLGITEGTKSSLCGNYETTAAKLDAIGIKDTYMEQLRKTNSKFGVNTIKLNQLITKKVVNSSCSYEYNACTDNDFKYSLTLAKDGSTDISNVYACVASNNMSYKKSISGTSTSLKCYENIEYDFSKVKNLLSNKIFSSNQLIEIPTGTLTIQRTCYAVGDGATSVSNSSIAETMNQINNDISNNTSKTYYQKNFIFNFNNQSYLYQIDNNSKTVAEVVDSDVDCGSKNIKGYCLDNKYVQSTITYTYKLKDTDTVYNSKDLLTYNNLFITNDDEPNNTSILFNNSEIDSNVVIAPNITEYSNDYENYIKLNNVNYGINKQTVDHLITNGTYDTTTQQIITTSKKNINIFINNITYSMSKDTDLTCEFDSTVTNSGVLDGEGVKFRVISLSNPFPARDGTSRLPGTNWLNDYNYVYEYITNNRNIQEIASEKKLKSLTGGSVSVYNSSTNGAGKSTVAPEMMYINLEPIYTVTLTPSTMLEIRKYNQSHAYDDIILDCENGKKCASAFIADLVNDGKITGSCSSYQDEATTTFNVENPTTSVGIAYIRGCSGVDKAGTKTVYNSLAGNKKCSFNEKYDINRDGVINQEDIDTYSTKIINGELTCNGNNCTYQIEGKEKRINYYSCADKTAESGG